MRKLLALLVSSALSLCLAEVLLRSSGEGAYLVWKPGVTTVSHVVPGLMPGIEGEAVFAINSAGLRGDEFAPEQRYRILALGGSTTECFYLDAPEAWPALLQANLTEGWGVPVWVGSAGKSGHTARNHVLQALKLLEQYPDIDVLLVLVGVNDFHQFLARDGGWKPRALFAGLAPEHQLMELRSTFAVLPARLQTRGPFYKRTELWGLLRRQLAGTPLVSSVQANVLDEGGTIYETWRSHRRAATGIRTELPKLGAVLAEYRRDLAAIVGHARRAGVRPVFLTQPSMWRADLPPDLRDGLLFGGVGDYFSEIGKEYYSVEALAKGMKRFNAELISLCEELEVEYVDLARALPKDQRTFFDDCHFNESGARAVASLVAQHFLEAHTPRPARSDP